MAVIASPGHRRARLAGRLRRQAGAWIGLGILVVALAGGVCASRLAPYPADAIDLAAQLQPPSSSHLAGTDFYGRDSLSRLLYGARATLLTALVAVSVAMAGGTSLGLLAGYAEGWPAHILVAVVDLMLAFPALLLALMVVALLGPGLPTLALAVGIAGIPAYARLVRSVVLTIRSALYIEAARTLGASAVRILTRHLLPGVVAPVLALASLDVGRAILAVAALGFLGLGVSPPLAEWGSMLYEGRQYIATAPLTSALPGLAISLTVLAATLVGEALAEAVNPYQR